MLTARVPASDAGSGGQPVVHYPYVLPPQYSSRSWQLQDLQCTPLGAVELPGDVFNVPVRTDILHQVCGCVVGVQSKDGLRGGRLCSDPCVPLDTLHTAPHTPGGALAAGQGAAGHTQDQGQIRGAVRTHAAGPEPEHPWAL
jgi:hypothetical protein